MNVSQAHLVGFEVAREDISVGVHAPARDGLAHRIRRLQVDTAPALHHELQPFALPKDGNVLRGVTGHADDVCKPPGRNLADLAL